MWLFWRRFHTSSLESWSARKDPRFPAAPGRRKNPVIFLGGALPGQGDPGAAAARAWRTPSSSGVSAPSLWSRSTTSRPASASAFLYRESGFGAFYFGLPFVFAALVAVAIAGLVRPPLFRAPQWLGPLSYESGVIAVLIFMLMVTYHADVVVCRNRQRPDKRCGGCTR